MKRASLVPRHLTVASACQKATTGTIMTENKENLNQLQSISNGYKHSLKQLEKIGMGLRNQTYFLENENRILQEHYTNVMDENALLTEHTKSLQFEVESKTQLIGKQEKSIKEKSHQIETLTIENNSFLGNLHNEIRDLSLSVGIAVDCNEILSNDFIINCIQNIKSKLMSQESSISLLQQEKIELEKKYKDNEELLTKENNELKKAKENLAKEYEKEVMVNSLKGKQVDETKTEMDDLTEQYSQTTVENSYLKKELEEVREVLKKKEEEHEKTIENLCKENNEMKEKNLSVIDDLTVLKNQEKLELTSKLQTTQDSLNIITKELELIKADHTSILLEKERLICSSSLLEKKKISAERRLIAAEKTISGHEKTISGYENKIAETENKIAETENKTAESENMLIYLLEKLQLREEDIDEGVHNATVLDKFHSLLQELLNGDQVIENESIFQEEMTLNAKKLEALEAQSEMVRQVTECTSTTISTERARCASLSIALDQTEEKLEKIEKEFKETKQKLSLSEEMQSKLNQQLENVSSSDESNSQKEIFSLQRTVLEMKHTIEEARRELSLLSNERNTLRLKVQTMNDQHVEEIRSITNGPWKQFINEQKKYWIKLQNAASTLERNDNLFK